VQLEIVRFRAIYSLIDSRTVLLVHFIHLFQLIIGGRDVLYLVLAFVQYLRNYISILLHNICIYLFLSRILRLEQEHFTNTITPNVI
jgi:hypothetical protein